MITIDQYSLAALPIEMMFNEIALSVGTAFVWKHLDSYFLITNWHNVSGRDPTTGKHLSKTAAEPNRIRVWFNHAGHLGKKLPKYIDIRQQTGEPLWLVHPQHAEKVDVVALPIGNLPDVDMHPINEMDSANLQLSVGMDVYVLGFPYGLGASGFPVWKRGSFASEPEISPAVQLQIFVDTASRPGMSGSPVIRRSWVSHMMEGDSVNFGPGTATRFVGVYSGRITAADPLDAQLGVTWPASFVSEIVAGNRVDS